jgi:uncharacterized membrane protein YfcA/uncharacterized protein involved in tolerance to divalent cations
MDFLGLELTSSLLLVFAAIGIATGVLTGLTGASGMAVLISSLLMIGSIDIRQIIGLTFVVTLANAFASIGPYWVRKNIDVRVTSIAAISIALTVPIGHHLAIGVPAQWLEIAMTICLMLIGIKLIIFIRPGKRTEAEQTSRVSTWVLIPFGLATGSIMGITGGGGGVLIAAFLILVMRMPAKVAIGSSIVIMAISAIPGVILHARDGTAPWGIAVVILATSTIASFFAARFANRVPSHVVQRILGVYLVVSSILVLIGTISSPAEPEMSKNESNECIVIITTSDDEKVLNNIAGKLIDLKLAACAQIVGPITSRYCWQGRIQDSQEWQCQIKTTRNGYAGVEKLITQMHNYEMPEIVALDITAGSDTYLGWVRENVST